MHGVTEEAGDLFRVDLARIRGGGSGWGRLTALLGGSDGSGGRRAVVDPFAVGRAIVAVMDRCDVRTVDGQRLLWNEYRVFLSRPDFDRLVPLEHRLGGELARVLDQEVRRLKGELAGPPVVRLLPDEGEGLAEGEARIRVAFAPVERPAERGEITVRLGRTGGAPPLATEGTDRLPEATGPTRLVATWPGGEAGIPDGTQVVFGRAHPHPAGRFVALPGASPRISRRHAWLEATPDGVEVGRVVGANPVEVNGQVLPEGASITVDHLPATISLSGEMTLQVRRVEPR